MKITEESIYKMLTDKRIRTEVLAVRVTKGKDSVQAIEESIKFWKEKFNNDLEKFLKDTMVA